MFSLLVQLYIEDNLAGSTNQNELHIRALENLYFSLPPINEQQRIVFKIEESFSTHDDIHQIVRNPACPIKHINQTHKHFTLPRTHIDEANKVKSEQREKKETSSEYVSFAQQIISVYDCIIRKRPRDFIPL